MYAISSVLQELKYSLEIRNGHAVTIYEHLLRDSAALLKDLTAAEL